MLPDRSDANAMRFPSAEYCGTWSTRVEEISRVAAPAIGAAGFAIGTRQMSVSVIAREKTSIPLPERVNSLTPSPANASRSGGFSGFPRSDIWIRHRLGL